MFIARSRQFQLLSLSLLAAADFTSAPVAHASCVKRTAAQYVKDADLVFIGRAGPLKIRGKESTQGIRVLHRIKGKPGKVFTRVRPAGMPIPNDRVYAEGEVALFFVRKGNIDLCAGNFQLAAQMPFIGEVLGHGPGEERKPGRTIIMSAGSIVGNPAGWTVTGELNDYHVEKIGGNIILSPPQGTVVYIK